MGIQSELERLKLEVPKLHHYLMHTPSKGHSMACGRIFGTVKHFAAQLAQQKPQRNSTSSAAARRSNSVQAFRRAHSRGSRASMPGTQASEDSVLPMPSISSISSSRR